MALDEPTSACKRKERQDHGRVSKRSKKAHTLPAGVFACFTLDGNDVNLHRRSNFSPKRKEEVKGIRRKGACLRCRLLKRACSGEDPCKTCTAAARAAASSKALMWMECIRPSFQAINIFDKGTSAIDQSRINSIMNDLLNDDVYLDFHIPFALNVEAASSHLAKWLSEDDSPSTFSVVGVFSCSSNTNLLQNALDPNLARDLRLFVHLTTHLYTTGMQGGYQEYTDEEVQSVRDCVGNRLLLALDPLVRPSEIEASEDKLGKLRSLFLLLLGTIVGMRYTCSEVFEETTVHWTELHSKQEALLRLLCHYLIYIGKATALLESCSDEKSLLHKWRTQWNKPAAFTWNSTQGLEMHYRIEPPADWIVSSSEDESLSSIDIDLSEFEDISLFTQDADLLKCSGCGTFWATLSDDNLCQFCDTTMLNGDNLWSQSFSDGLSMDSSFGIDPFRTMFQATTPRQPVLALKDHCSRYFGTSQMSSSWSPTIVQSQGYLDFDNSDLHIQGLVDSGITSADRTPQKLTKESGFNNLSASIQPQETTTKTATLLNPMDKTVTQDTEPSAQSTKSQHGTILYLNSDTRDMPKEHSRVCSCLRDCTCDCSLDPMVYELKTQQKESKPHDPLIIFDTCQASSLDKEAVLSTLQDDLPTIPPWGHANADSICFSCQGRSRRKTVHSHPDAPSSTEKYCVMCGVPCSGKWCLGNCSSANVVKKERLLI